jgi:hypothetical protein
MFIISAAPRSIERKLTLQLLTKNENYTSN